MVEERQKGDSNIGIEELLIGAGSARS